MCGLAGHKPGYSIHHTTFQEIRTLCVVCRQTAGPNIKLADA